MSSGRALIARYVFVAIVPYLFLSLFLLTAVLFAQQASRFAELALYTRVPFPLLAQIAVALLPGVLVFTLPMATLAGIIIGLARMGSDSEIVALRAAGVGTWSLLWPVLLLGVIATVGTTYLHMEEGPQSAKSLRRIALEGALIKLDSPVEPRTFNTEIPGYVIYVRDGDKLQGSWGRVFIYSQQADGSTRVVTARSGRIDSSAEQSELVLSDAVATRIPPLSDPEPKSYVVERLEQLRVEINTGRASILERLNRTEPETEEMAWNELQLQSLSHDPGERLEAQRTLHRRMALAVAPFVLALAGGAIGLRVRRGGRGFGVLLSLGVMLLYYLTSLLGESLSRAGTTAPRNGAWMATLLLVVFSCILLFFGRIPHGHWFQRLVHWKVSRKKTVSSAGQVVQHTGGTRRWGFLSLLDISLFRSLILTFSLAFMSLALIFMIFTLFELWRFIATRGVPSGVVASYLFFLLPLMTVELFPATMLIAVLVTYALLSRRSETVAWWSAGQSVYRLMIPGLLFAVLAAAGTWLVQEHVMPSSNLKQDALRAQIRGGEARAMTITGRQWLASVDNNRFYAYEFDEHNNTLLEPAVYELGADGVHLTGVISGSLGRWTASEQIAVQHAEQIKLTEMDVERKMADELLISKVEPQQVFKPTIDKPSQLSSSALSSYLKAAKQRGMEISALAVALQRKYAGPFNVIVMAFVGIPLALAFGRRGAVMALCAAVGVGVAYWGVSGGFQQLGQHGLLPPAVAGWSPPVIFAAAGTYFLSRVRT